MAQVHRVLCHGLSKCRDSTMLWSVCRRAGTTSVPSQAYNFTGDNVVGVTEKVLQSIVATNSAPSTVEWGAYGTDPATLALNQDTAEFFDLPQDQRERLFVRPLITGTAANDLLLFSLARARSDDLSAVICSECAHIYTDELSLGGGLKLLPIPASLNHDGKVTPASLEAALQRYSKVMFGGISVLSLSQSTESGTVYTPEELCAVCDVAKRHGLLVHMDGARFFNALAHVGCSAAELTWKAGIDAISLGGSKSGAFADAAIVFDTEHVPMARGRIYAKQRGHSVSKQRFLACQISALFNEDEGVQQAVRANAAATHLAEGLQTLNLSLRHAVQSNCVFVTLSDRSRSLLQESGIGFFQWDGRPATEPGDTRFVCSFKTTFADVDHLLEVLAKSL
eukprot:TRINITY_DN57937_c0_g1_i1.p1 TRINITY_DN57937_c0_g1~~TRINITY_DN57937_c0_g1_i1.p1  ORF type:complete len:421 (+),score=17.92 TRINITY_DN57937_c0_g1_i1:80-1264(+)